MKKQQNTVQHNAYINETDITAIFISMNVFYEIPHITINKTKCLWFANKLIEKSTNMLVVHAGPRLRNSSLSLDVRQLSSRSWASGVGKGAITREASPPDDPAGSMSLRLDSTTSDNGANRKCTSSGALGSRILPFSRAYVQQMHTTCTNLQTARKIQFSRYDNILNVCTAKQKLMWKTEDKRD